MHQLSPFTCRRLNQLPRLTSVWECDRRPLSTAGYAPTDSAEAAQGDCIIWVDSLQGVVRGLSVVPKETGHEAIVRALLQAIEAPQGGVEPARPRKVVVCDREIQFFLRGALQDLDIPVEHMPALPVIDEVFEKLQTPDIPRTKLPRAFEEVLLEKAALLWQDAPWDYLSEQEILAIELNCWEIETLYLSVLGLAGMEYGLLFYRDLASLQQFRHKLLNSEDFSDGMQQAFLEQNCLFINFNPVNDVIPLPTLGQTQSARAVEYEFGSLHPLEGLRSQLAEEEAASLVVVFEALHRFFKKHDLDAEDFALKPTTSRFRIANPARANLSPKSRKRGAKADKADKVQAEEAPLSGLADAPDTLSVKISTMPEVSTAFLEETLASPEEPDLTALVDDSVPEGSLIMLSSYTDEELAPLKQSDRIHYQRLLKPPVQLPDTQTEWPVLTIQTTRPKAQILVEQLQQEGGIQAICFNPGSDPVSAQVFQVGLLQTAQGQLHLFNEYEMDNPLDIQALEKWAQDSADNNSCCGCIIATGATGSKRGRPTAKEVIAFFETQAKPPEELGLAPLIMSYAVEWE
ncbi:hypothetical protein BH23CYA1_BH23CYA1_19870 [soil metagenome]